MATPLKSYSEHCWNTFVRPSVRLKAGNPDSRELITKMMPYFPRECMVIAAFLDDADQFWKVNYHWELLSRRSAMAMKLKIAPASLTALARFGPILDANAPDPKSGYLDSKVVGKPHDRTSAAKIVERWHSLRELKGSFRKILDAEGIPEGHPPSEAWDLAAAPLAKPGTSKHGTGYAFDIAGHGKNQLIKSIASGLHATLVFDEKSHVHVEFKQGVIIDRPLVADDYNDGRWAGWAHLA